MKLKTTDIHQHIKHSELIVETYECVTSTNTLLKQRGRNGSPHGLVIAAESQTAGRGRMGRDFFSPADTGVYFSLLLRPDLSPEDCLLITTAAAVACANVLERYSESEAKIKWVNDVYINNKKVCGILTEASFTGSGKLDFVVLGIGINISPPKDGFPSDIISKAGTVLNSSTEDFRGLMIADVLNAFMDSYKNLEERAFIQEYRDRSLLNGTQIEVLKHDCVKPATALFVDEDLRLVVQYPDNTTERLSSGDVSIKKA